MNPAGSHEWQALPKLTIREGGKHIGGSRVYDEHSAVTKLDEIGHAYVGKAPFIGRQCPSVLQSKPIEHVLENATRPIDAQIARVEEGYGCKWLLCERFYGDPSSVENTLGPVDQRLRLRTTPEHGAKCARGRNDVRKGRPADGVNWKRMDRSN